MNFDQYQMKAGRTAIYPGRGEMTGLLYVSLGLGEVGEIQNKVKKILRDKGGVIDEGDVGAIAKEMGDTLWYLSQLADELGILLSDVARFNLAKLADRAERGVLQGNGDDR